MGFGADGGTVLNTGQVTTSASSALVIAASGVASATGQVSSARTQITLTNTSTVASAVLMYVGNATGVTTTTGHYIPPASSWTTTYRGALYVIASGAGTLTYAEETNA